MACTRTSGTSMISRVRPSNDRGIRRFNEVAPGRGKRARMSDAGFQNIASAAHGVQEAWLARVDLDLTAQAYDLDVDGTLPRVIHTERLGHPLARQDLIGLASQRGQQRRFTAGQANRASGVAQF